MMVQQNLGDATNAALRGKFIAQFHRTENVAKNLNGLIHL